jgi:galactonate dehydratase
VPNFRIMEIDIDGVPWRDEIVDTPAVFDKGDYILPKGPGWGVEVNEAGLRKHPVK